MRVRKCLDGGCRIVVTELVSNPPICIINVYMPCRNSRTSDDFEAILSEVQEILVKFSSSHAIILLGDMNSSLMCRANNEQDKELKKFCQKNELISMQRGISTFLHVNGKDTAEIDYILLNKKAKLLTSTVRVENFTASNVSDHIPVYIILNVRTSTKSLKPVTVKLRPRWDKCDTMAYEDFISQHLNPFDTPQSDFEFLMSLGHLTSTLKRAACISIPNHRTSKQIKVGPKRIWNSEISEALRRCKELWWQWRQIGEPSDNTHPLVVRQKQAKRNLRKAQRQAAARKTIEKVESIMNSHGSDKEFYRLVKEQRKSKDSSLQFLCVNNKILETPEEVCDGWATHFGSLATPLMNENFDDAVKSNYTDDISRIHNICMRSNQEISPATIEEVQLAIKKLKLNKAADSLDITGEHLIFGGITIINYLRNMVNYVFERKQVPVALKEGLVTPIFKKGDKADPANYRGITVTTVVLKVIEHILNRRHNPILEKSQSVLQKGFSPGRSSMDAALILSECISEANNSKSPLIVAMLDAQKAFDVVDHDTLLRRLFLDGICGGDWLLLQNMYSDLTSVVKWEGTLSCPFVIRQGVRQGGVLSTAHYKRYNNPLLIQLENKFTGAKIGHIRIPHVTVADDLTLMSHSQTEMQSMVPTSGDFANRTRFVIHPKKSCILTYWDKYAQQKSTNYLMNGVEMTQVQHSTHLGIQRESTNKANIAEKISLGRRTAYSLMGAGLHCGNGLKQSVCGKLWTTYVVPRLLYGLEVLNLSRKDISMLEQYQRKALKQIQSLPDKTHSSAVLAMLGILPLECVIHKNMLNLFGRWITSDGIEKDIAVRQLATKTVSEQSWFNEVKYLLELYDLPLPSQLLEEVPSKSKWKRMVNKAIFSAVEEQWRKEIRSSTTLKYINPDSIKVGRAHHVWSSVRNNVHDSRRAQLKCRVLTGTYIPYRVTVQCLTNLQSTLLASCVSKALKQDNTSWLNARLCITYDEISTREYRTM